MPFESIPNRHGGHISGTDVHERDLDGPHLQIEHRPATHPRYYTHSVDLPPVGGEGDIGGGFKFPAWNKQHGLKAWVFDGGMNRGRYADPPSPELLNLIEHAHETKAFPALLDKLAEEYPELTAGAARAFQVAYDHS